MFIKIFIHAIISVLVNSGCNNKTDLNKNI